MIEDWLDPIGVSFRDFVERMTHGSWIFGFSDALRRAGLGTVFVCTSSSVDSPQSFHSPGLGTNVWVLPRPRSVRAIRRRLSRDRSLRRRVADAPLWRVAPYLATPPRGLAAVLRREGCTAVLCQEYEYPRFDISIAVGMALRLPVFATFQGGSRPASRTEWPLRALTMRRAAGFVVGREDEARQIRERYRVRASKIARVSNPIDTEAWRPQDKARARAALGIPAETKVVAWHGRVEINTKGLDLLVEAWQGVVSSVSNYRLQLRLLGTGTDASLFASLLSRLDSETVEWQNAFVIDVQQVRAFLSAADLYVLPSRHEGVPIAALEAMSSGLPVVATKEAGVTELLRPGTDRAAGTVVPPDSTALERAIKGYLDDDALRAVAGATARREVVEQCDTSVIGPRLREVLTSGSDRTPFIGPSLVRVRG